MDITAVLLNAQSPDVTARKAAEAVIQSAQESNFGEFAALLTAELAGNDKPIEARNLAGLVLKNALDALDDARKEQLKQRWVAAVNPTIKAQIKQHLLATLQCPEKSAGQTAAQVVAKIAAIELPRKEWEELIPALIATAQAGAGVPKQATMNAIGYTCEEINADILAQAQVDQLLTAVVQGMRPEETDMDVRHAATQALLNALYFAKQNFAKDNERQYIMQMVCESTRCPDAKVREAAWECLVSIHQEYYDMMNDYIKDVFNLSMAAAQDPVEGVSLQAFELWSTLCEIEFDLHEENSDYPTNHNFVGQALQGLVPMLLATLTTQEEGQYEDDSWNKSKAAANTLGLVAQTAKDDIVALVLPWVQENAGKTDWRSKEAALIAFGSIMDGPEPSTLKPLVHQSLNFILEQLKDPDMHVKDTAAWCLGSIFEFVPDAIEPSMVQVILEALVPALAQPPHIAQKVCWSINLFSKCKEDGSLLTPFFNTIVQNLVQVADRQDGEGVGLRTSAYEALNEVILNTNGIEPTVLSLVQPMLAKLGLALQASPTSPLTSALPPGEERANLMELQSLYCGVLQTIINKLGQSPQAAQIEPMLDSLMQYLMAVLECGASVDAFGAVDALMLTCGPKMIKWMHPLYIHIVKALQNHQEWEVCNVVVGLISNVCTFLGTEVPETFWDQIVSILLESLGSGVVNRNVKPTILSCIGDLAMYQIGSGKYIGSVLHILQQAAASAHQAWQEVNSEQASGDYEEEVDHINALRSGILEAYTGIFQGVTQTSAETNGPLEQQVNVVIHFIVTIAQDDGCAISVQEAAVGLLGDIAQRFKGISPDHLRNHHIARLIKDCLESENPQQREMAHLTKEKVEKLVGPMGI